MTEVVHFPKFHIILNIPKMMDIVRLNSIIIIMTRPVHLFFSFAPTLERRAFVKRFVSLQLLNRNTVGRTPWTGDQLIARPLPTHDNTNTE
jgi:hypothetical protein